MAHSTDKLEIWNLKFFLDAGLRVRSAGQCNCPIPTLTSCGYPHFEGRVGSNQKKDCPNPQFFGVLGVGVLFDCSVSFNVFDFFFGLNELAGKPYAISRVFPNMPNMFGL